MALLEKLITPPAPWPRPWPKIRYKELIRVHCSVGLKTWPGTDWVGDILTI